MKHSLSLPLGKERNSFQVLGLLVLIVLLIIFLSYWPISENSWSTFTTVFLGIFIEALPFLLLGTIASGLVEAFLDQEAIHRYFPKSPFLGAVCGGFLGLFFPVCECGVVPLVRRLFRKGFPIPAGISFLLAAPVINPIVIFSTATAFGFGNILLLRVGLTLLIAVLTGLIFTVIPTPWEILRPTPWITSNLEGNNPDLSVHSQQQNQRNHSFFQKIGQAFLVALDEFFEMGRYLIFGSIIAAGMQTFIPQTILLGIGKGPVLSVLVMMGLAILLSICSTVDSFVALGFVNTFSTGAILAFLLYGPMVDIKSTLMFLRVFKSRPVLYMIVIPFLLVLLVGVSMNTFFSW